MILIKETSIEEKDAQELIHELNHVLEKITGNSGASSFEPSTLHTKRSVFLVAYIDDVPMGCGAFHELSETTAEIKRVYVRENSEGVAHKIIETLEDKAKEKGYQTIKLETRKVNEHAVSFYRNIGYSVCDNYGKYVGVPEAVCFQKHLF